MAHYYVDPKGRIIKTKKKTKYDVDSKGRITEDIAPVSTTRSLSGSGRRMDVAPVKEEDEKKLDFFQKGSKIGDQKGFWNKVLDVPQAILGTAGDAGLGVLKGAGSLVEGIGDLGLYGVAGVADFVGADKFSDKTKKFAQKNTVQDITKGADDYLNQYSVLGKTSDAITQGVGQVGTIILSGGLGASAGLGAVGTTALTTGVMGASSAGSGMSEAYQGGATDAEAFKYGMAKGAIDAGTEMMFGGFGKAVKAVGLSRGIGGFDDMLAQKISSKITNHVLKNATEFGVKASGEGVEEVVAGLLSAKAKQLTYMSDSELRDLVADENLLEQFVVGTVTSGMIQSGYIPATAQGSLKEANETNRDFITGYTQNEQAVIDKVVDERVKELETDEKKLTKKEIGEIESEVKTAFERGEIDIDTIESVIGGELYTQYNDLVKESEEYEQLYKTKDIELSQEQRDRRDVLVEKNKKNPYETELTSLKERLSQEIDTKTANDTFIRESYNEKARRSKAFVADLTQYNEKEQEMVKKAVESGVLNDTRKTHDFVNLLAKLHSEKGVNFDFTTNEALKESGFAIDGKSVNGYVKGDNVVLNINSNKALNKVVGHEIAHVLENADPKLYEALESVIEQFATTKGEYESRYKAIEKLYEGRFEGTEAEVKAKLKKELTADLVGDYLFTDSDFVNNLYTTKPNVFKRIYDEIKYFLKIATAGSKEAKELEKVKKVFKKVYSEADTSNVETNSDSSVEYSLSSIANTFFGDENMSANEFAKLDYKQTQGYKDYVEQVVNNYRQTRENFDEAVARKEIEKAIDGIVKVAIASKKAGYDILDSKETRSIKDSKDRLLFSSLEPNSDYFTSSDISTICDKRKNFAEIYDDIVRAEEAKGVPAGKRFFDNVDNYFYIHKVLADKGLTQPCRQCYVESMRKNLSPMASAFLRLVRETDPNNKANDQLYQQKGKNKGTLKTNNATLRERVLERLAEYGMSVNDLSVETLSTEDGLAQLKITAPLVYEAFNSFYGQSKPKMPKSATPFRFGELTALLTDERGRIKQSVVDKINSTGGFRLQSYSDFQIQNYTDVLQVIFEAGTLGLTGHAYTKVPAFLEATEGTNLKRNISIFMYMDGNEWRIDRNDSFPYTLEEIYDIVNSDKTGNTSIIAVSQNEDMSAWIMANDNVGYGIPFHKSGLKMGTVRDTIVREDGREIKGYSGTKDHTRQQTEVWAKSEGDHRALTKVKNGINIYDFWDFDNNANLTKNELIEKNIKAYIDACYEAGYLPKFREYVMNNGKVLNSVLEYSKKLGYVSQDATIDDISFNYRGYQIPYGYYKFLGDFGMFTPDGKASPHEVLSLENYDFDKAVDFFANAEELRRNEILQQFSNGEERQKYRDSNLSAEELLEVVKQKRKEVVDEIVPDVSDVNYSLSSQNDIAPTGNVQYSLSEDTTQITTEHYENLLRESEYYKDVPVAKNLISNNKFISDVIKEYGTDFYNRLRAGKNLSNEEQKIATALKRMDSLIVDYVVASELADNSSFRERYVDETHPDSKLRDMHLRNESFHAMRLKNEFAKEFNEIAKTMDDFKNGIARDSKNRQLTKEQQEYFKDNHEVFYKDGKLKQYYHGTDEAGFFVLDPSKSDDGISFFLSDNVEVASSYMYAGSDNEFNPYDPPIAVETFEDLQRRFENTDYSVEERDGSYIITDEEGDEIIEASSPKEAYEEWREGYDWYGEYSDTSMYYSFYVKSSNPLVVEGNHSNWDDIEFNGETVTTRDLADYAKKNGYDSLVINDVYDIGEYGSRSNEKESQIVVVFDSNQVKSIYNENPTENEDIRYSMSDSNGDIAPTGKYEVYGKDIALEQSTVSEMENVAPVAQPEVVQGTDEPEEPMAPMQSTDEVLYSLEEQIAEIDRVVDAEDLTEPTELPTVESFDTMLENYINALEGYKTAKATAETAYDEAINKKEAEYNALKRKNTKKATDLLMQIENLKLRKSNNMFKLDSKIAKVQETIDKLENGIPTKRQIYHRNIVDKIKSVFASKGFDFDKVLESAKDKGTFSSVDNTPQRFIEKSLGYKEGQILNDLTVNKVAQNETEGIKWLNSFTDKKAGLLARISKEYGIKPRSKESASAQMYAEGFWVDDDGNFIKYGDEELAKDYPDAKVQENIKKLAKDERIRKIYDETLEMINESRKRNLYPEIPRRNNYFLHFREMEDTFSKLGIPFNPNDIRLKDLPTDINGMTADLKPGQPYFASAKQRLGYKTTYDLVGGVERYLNSAKNQIYHIDDIQTLRALRNYIADTFGQAKGLESLDSMTEEEAIARIEEVFNSHLSTFAKFLNEEANVLAGKTSLTDRGLEGVIGRRGIQFLDTVNRQVGSNMVGGNISSALTNTVSTVQAFAKGNKFDATKAFVQTVNNQLGSIFGKSDGFVENNPMMIRRKGIERMTRTPWERVTDVGYLFMGAVDNVASEFIVRTKFNELTRKGMSEQQAHIEADKWASRILGDRSLGQQPQLYNSKMLGLVTKFQLEVRNQLDSQFYDTIQEAKVSNEEIGNALERNMKTSAKVASTFFQLAVLQHLFGQAFESVAGYNPAFDIVEVLMRVFGLDDDEESEDTALDNLEQGFLTLLGDLPYTSTLTGGRVPISSALPVEQFITGKDDYGNEKSRWDTIKETAPYYLMPTGYGQLKKTKQGLEMFSEEHPVAGSYTNSGNLRFPIEDTPANRVRSAVFGQYASDNARDYFDNERQPLKEKQIAEFAELDIPIKDYWKYREGLKEHDTLDEKFDYIAGLDLPVEKKNIMINNIVDRKEAVDLSNYDDFSDYEEFDFATKNAEKYEYLQSINVSYKEYNKSEESREAYNWAYQYPEKYHVAKAVTDDLVAYRKYAKEISSIEGDKDGNGNTINGSAKRKKTDYINGLNLDYGQKIILYRSLFDSKEDKNNYNLDIVNYLNDRSDISYEEMVSILESLDMVVLPDGTVQW